MDEKTILSLNIGGKIFFTYSKTLINPLGEVQFDFKQENFFTKLLKQDKIDKDEKGRIFIDRDPKYFDIILNYFRYQGDISSIELPKSFKQLLKEVSFYELNHLQFLLTTLNTNSQNFYINVEDYVNSWKLGNEPIFWEKVFVEFPQYSKFYNYVDICIESCEEFSIGIINDKSKYQSMLLLKNTPKEITKISVWFDVENKKMKISSNNQEIKCFEYTNQDMEWIKKDGYFHFKIKNGNALIVNDIHPDLLLYKSQIMKWRMNHLNGYKL